MSDAALVPPKSRVESILKAAGLLQGLLDGATPDEEVVEMLKEADDDLWALVDAWETL